VELYHRRKNMWTGIIIAAVVLLIVIPSIIKIVPEYKRIVIFRLGRCVGAKGPGLVIVIPLVDVPVWADLRESFLEIPEQTCITKDNAPISIDFLIYWKVTDPVKSVVEVNNFAGAAQGIATTTLRAIAGDIPLDDFLAKREELNIRLRTKMDEVTERWGVKVTSVEIREIIPPKDIQDAMNRQMSAERTRRAVVTEADGKKSAAITIAEGEKQSKILQAEGEGQAQVLRANGYSKALEEIFSAAGKIDSNTMMIQYFEALKALGNSASTKYIIPLEFTSLIEPIIKKAKESLK
jgi:regulator of protease activity HflC (stomatin/prohibitin superfamily)